MATVIIYVHGGVISEIDGLPPGVNAVTLDYDAEAGDENVVMDDEGVPHFRGEWNGPPVTLDTIADDARILANQLFGPVVACVNAKESCIRKAETKPLTKVEINLGWTRRPFHAYDTNAMCCACSAYWHAEMAAQDLHRLRCVRHKLMVPSKGES